ncbi:16S rRNA (cytosine(1402)-N(4))-methyltransferase RsmH [Mycoplasma sp. 128]|uniref:16S rRNA (cytosine(1402)-N(4))-methyltransferase RsmH n=1 Tax=Mycoplasma sp. 3341 TaxID=3447506 RepID=UPI003F65B441
MLLYESIEALDIKPNGIYVDVTLGRGGHSEEILKKLTTGHLYCFDKDKQAILEANERLKKVSNKFTLIHSDFASLKEQLRTYGVTKIDGLIADLGISSPQIDDASRGFSYSKDAKLDMRMNQEQEISAWDIVNQTSEEQLAKILQKNADVKLFSKVAKAICKSRPIDSTLQLCEVIKNAYPAAILRQKNPYRAIFQAIRIEVNQEFEAIEKMLPQAVELLTKNGKLAVISFHSLEDRIVKNYFKSLKINSDTYKLPVQITEGYKFKKITVTEQEATENYRSRSATLRVLEKLI